MNHDYQIADISSECVEEVNHLQDKLTQQTNKDIMRSNLSSAVAGNKRLFNLDIQGAGILCIESSCPQEELVEIVLENGALKVDGNMAIAWSGSLDFTVETSGKSLIVSAASGEGLVNVYRVTGKFFFLPQQIDS